MKKKKEDEQKRITELSLKGKARAPEIYGKLGTLKLRGYTKEEIEQMRRKPRGILYAEVYC